MYGDFLHDLAWFAFWSPWYPAWENIDFPHEAAHHYESIGLVLQPQMGREADEPGLVVASLRPGLVTAAPERPTEGVRERGRSGPADPARPPPAPSAAVVLEPVMDLRGDAESREGSEGLSTPEMSRSGEPGPDLRAPVLTSSAKLPSLFRNDGRFNDEPSTKSITGSRCAPL